VRQQQRQQRQLEKQRQHQQLERPLWLCLMGVKTGVNFEFESWHCNQLAS